MMVYTIGTTNDNRRIGATITGLPFGINKIEYQIKVTTVTNKGQDDY